MENCKCFMTKRHFYKYIMSSVSKIKNKGGVLAKIKVDRGVHYNNKGVQHLIAKITQREHCYSFTIHCQSVTVVVRQ